MNFKDVISMAAATFSAYKLRSGLTILGIVIGNASVIVMVGIGQGAQTFVSREIEGLGPNILSVTPGSVEAQRASFNVPNTLVLSDAEAIAEQIPSIRGSAPEYNQRGVISAGNLSSNLTIVGTSSEFPLVRRFDLGRGRFFSELDMQRANQVVVLGARLANRLLEGKQPVGQQVRLDGVSFEVIGVLAEKGSNIVGLDYDEAALIPLQTMASRLAGNISPLGIELSYVVFSIKDEQSMRAAQFQITNLLRLRHRIVSEDDFTVRSQKDLLELTGTVTGALTALLASIAGISLLVGGLGVMNIMLVSVSERTQEIGLRKAIGASRRDILFQFTLEAILMSASGGIIGALLGMSGAIVIGWATPFQPEISSGIVVLSIAVSGSIGLVFGTVPARRAANLEPIDALRIGV
ncbi:ABC transporter permease [Synechococcus sp. PCC 7336]|uniref:ABC transporter permease n=1 Tax=Synechococcus sp. PCC 7336 TaxID=195250 RepID=UPI0003705DF1|nr:ABC transporter permease [Synechococcus sp. PCC 7336]